VHAEKSSVATSLCRFCVSPEHARMNRGPQTATATIELNLGAQAPKGVLTDG
jgi:hypothetical protein